MGVGCLCIFVWVGGGVVWVRCVHRGTCSSVGSGDIRPSHMTTCQPVMPRPPGTMAELAEPGLCLICVDVDVSISGAHYFGIFFKSTSTCEFTCICMCLFCNNK